MRPDLPLRRPGMQVRRKPIRRASPRLRLAQMYGLVLMFLSLVTVIALGDSPAFAARHLVVNGARFTGEAVVSEIVGMDGSPNLFRLRTDRVAEALVELPAVESASVEVRLPGTVVVTVVERQPKLIWVIGARRYVVDDTGLLFGEVDAAGNPIGLPADFGAGSTASASPAPSAPETPSATPSATPGAGPARASTAAFAADPPQGYLAQPALAAAKPTPKATLKPTPKATPKPAPKATPSPTPQPSPTTTLPPPPSLLPVPTPDSAATSGPEVVHLPVVYDRRAEDAGLTLGDVVDPIALDAGYRLASLTPADVGSQAASLAVVLDDQYGFMLSSGPNGWVAEFGFYTETLRKDTVIPEQVRDLRSLLLDKGEDHVAWVWLVADIAGNGLNTYIPR